MQDEGSLIYEPWRVRVNSVSSALFWCSIPGAIISLVLGSPWGYATAALAALAAIALVWRALRIRLVVTRQRVIVDNYWVTHNVPWSEIDGVGIALKGTVPRPALAFKRRDKRPIFAMATPLRTTDRREFQSAVLMLAPPSMRALPDGAGVIGSDRALSNQLRLWWVRRGHS